jgi:hypothetical protein
LATTVVETATRFSASGGAEECEQAGRRTERLPEVMYQVDRR